MYEENLQIRAFQSSGFHLTVERKSVRWGGFCHRELNPFIYGEYENRINILDHTKG